MARLIRFEFRKLFKSHYFYVILAIALVFTLISGLTSSIIKLIASQYGEPYQMSAYLFVKSALSTMYLMLVGIFVAIASTEDNASGTMKNIIGKGYSRLKVFLAKYIVSFIGILIISLSVVAFATVFGLVAFDKTPIEENLAVIIFGQLLGLLAYHALYYAIASGFGKIGPAIAVSLVGPTGVTLILTAVDAALSANKIDVQISQYWVSELYANFTTTNTDMSKVLVCFLLLAVYFALSLFIGFLINRRREY